MARSALFWLLSVVALVLLAGTLIVVPQRIVHLAAPTEEGEDDDNHHHNGRRLNAHHRAPKTGNVGGKIVMRSGRRETPKSEATMAAEEEEEGASTTPSTPPVQQRHHRGGRAQVNQQQRNKGSSAATRTSAAPSDGASESGSGNIMGAASDDAGRPEAQDEASGRVGPSAAQRTTTKAHGDGRRRLASAKRRHTHRLIPHDVEELLLSAPMPDLVKNTTLLNTCQWKEKESSSNQNFARIFAKLFQEQFPGESGKEGGGGLTWFLDEGGLIGSGRAGAMSNADDDFDFFALLPNQLAPCRPDSVTCTPKEYDAAIHRFLMVFWKQGGMCINKFNPRLERFNSRKRLMYSFQLNREKQFDDADPKGAYPYDGDVPCFKESTPFAHMHLGILQENTGLLKTNVWAVGTTHPMDELDLRDILPVGRCRVGAAEAPCPKNITAFLTVRNRGEYRKKSSDGNCLLVRRNWGAARKRGAVDTVRKLSACGYNSMVDLADAFVESGFKDC